MDCSRRPHVLDFRKHSLLTFSGGAASFKASSASGMVSSQHAQQQLPPPDLCFGLNGTAAEEPSLPLAVLSVADPAPGASSGVMERPLLARSIPEMLGGALAALLSAQDRQEVTSTSQYQGTDLGHIHSAGRRCSGAWYVQARPVQRSVVLAPVGCTLIAGSSCHSCDLLGAIRACTCQTCGQRRRGLWGSISRMS